MTTETKRCEGRVHNGLGFRGWQCLHNAVVEREGAWYCGQHEPVRREQRRERAERARADRLDYRIRRAREDAIRMGLGQASDDQLLAEVERRGLSGPKEGRGR